MQCSPSFRTHDFSILECFEEERRSFLADINSLEGRLRKNYYTSSQRLKNAQKVIKKLQTDIIRLRCEKREIHDELKKAIDREVAYKKQIQTANYHIQNLNNTHLRVLMKVPPLNL